MLAAAMMGAISLATSAHAQSDEIQVYDGGLAEPGKFNLTWHNNFIASGSDTRPFPGALIPNKSFNGVFEWAYGVTDWFEAGLYLPLYSISKDRGASINGGKIRLLFARPHADDHKFFYGANFEFSYNAKHWDERRYTSEIRPIVGVHLRPWDFIFNPILDNTWTGGFKSLDFAPATRIAYNLSPMTAIAIEEYSDYGELRAFLPGRDQGHQLYAVYDRSTKLVDVEAGVGFGLTHGSDKLTLKLILSRDLN
jgi:hypothetical protein